MHQFQPLPLATDRKTDWFRIIIDLERNGYSHASIAASVGVGKTTVHGWKMGSEPRHDDGELLIMLWRMVTLNGRDSVPTVPRYSHLA